MCKFILVLLFAVLYNQQAMALVCHSLFEPTKQVAKDKNEFVFNRPEFLKIKDIFSDFELTPSLYKTALALQNINKELRRPTPERKSEQSIFNVLPNFLFKISQNLSQNKVSHIDYSKDIKFGLQVNDDFQDFKINFDFKNQKFYSTYSISETMQKSILEYFSKIKKSNISTESLEIINLLINFRLSLDKQIKANLFKDNNLTLDEYLILYVYTTGFYEPLNGYLYSKKNNNIKLDYLKNKLNYILKKMNPYKGLVKRVSNFKPDNFEKIYCVGCVVQNKGFTSTTLKDEYIIYEESSTPALYFEIFSKTGVEVSPLSKFSSEKEVLIRADAYFRVLKVEGNIITMEEL